jgi:nicotinamidase-related amidase
MASALLVIDVQEGMQPLTAHDGAGVVARIASLLARAREANANIVYVQHDGSAEPGNPLARGTPGHAIYRAIAPRSGEPVIVKRYCSAFRDTELDTLLKYMRVEELIVCGMQTEYCVDTTVRAAADRGYSVTLVADAHSTGDTASLKAAAIIAHHNATLAGDFAVLKRADEVEF